MAMINYLPTYGSVIGLVVVLGYEPVSTKLCRGVRRRRNDLSVTCRLCVAFCRGDTCVSTTTMYKGAMITCDDSPGVSTSFVRAGSRGVVHGGNCGIAIGVFASLHPFLRHLSSVGSRERDLRRKVGFAPSRGCPSLSEGRLVQRAVLTLYL